MIKLFKAFKCPFAVLALSVIASFFALAAAYIAQYVFSLEPCILCLYQRIPYAIAIAAGVTALAFSPHTKRLILPALGLSAIAYTGNSALAFYHTGVERKWWPSHLEGCSVPDLGSSPEELLNSILNAPAVRCDEIPWQDPLLGLSMANYNIVFCAGLAALCAYALTKGLRNSEKFNQCHNTHSKRSVE